MTDAQVSAGLLALKAEASRLGEMHGQLAPEDHASRELIVRRLGEIETFLRGDQPSATAGSVSFSVFKLAMQRVAEIIVMRTQPLSKRIAKLEKQVAELALKPGGISISANGVTVPGMEGLAAATAKLTETLGKPVTPVYDERGLLKGAVRVDNIGEAPGDPRLAAMQARLDKANETIKSLERRASRHAEHLARLESRLQGVERR